MLLLHLLMKLSGDLLPAGIMLPETLSGLELTISERLTGQDVELILEQQIPLISERILSITLNQFGIRLRLHFIFYHIGILRVMKDSSSRFCAIQIVRGLSFSLMTNLSEKRPGQRAQDLELLRVGTKRQGVSILQQEIFIYLGMFPMKREH